MSAALTGSNRPNLNPSPKMRFQESPDTISKHRSMVEDRTFQRAIDFALAEHQLLMALEVQRNPGSAAFAGLKSAGAVEFVSVLKTLSETPPVMKTQAPANLDHQA